MPTGVVGGRDGGDFDAAGDGATDDVGMDGGPPDGGMPDVGPGDVGVDDVGTDAGPCTTDLACGAGHYCDAGTCVPTKMSGARCAGAHECTSTFCVDGVCCDQACGGTCEACTGALRGSGFDGECGPIEVGSDPQDECAAQAASTCGTTGTCDGAAACARWSLGTVCSTTACSGGVAQPERTCDGSGTCVAVGTSTCSPYACGASDCLTSCTGDGDCDATAFCMSGTCVSHRTNGSACARNNDCASGFCADGVCCSTACTGTCVACAAAFTGGTDGICSAIATGTDPDAECAASSTATCGTDGVCDGAGACRLWANGTVCVATSCSAGTEQSARQCDGAGTCGASSAIPCAPYACAGTVCGTMCLSDLDCASGNYCASGACVPRLANGQTCAAPHECTSGNCVDGVCCNTACAGTCQACTAARTGGTNGTCAPIATGTDPDNECATSSMTSCATDGTCDGAGACRFWASGTVCTAQVCSSGNQVNADHCDGAGSCIDGGTTTCAPYLCSGTACTTSCASDAGCTAGHYCDATMHCVPTQSNGATCSSASQCASGICVDGVCCNSACAGTCQACSMALTGVASGTCSPIPNGSDPGNECAANSTSTCGQDGACNGAGACHLWAAGTVCVAASCASTTTLNRTDACDGSGHCVDGGTQMCSPYLCSGASCGTSCTSDADCASGDFCTTSMTCTPKLGNGSMCTGSSQCTSGNCVDGFCCNTACGGTCQACAGALTGGANGTCAGILAGTDPSDECAATDPTTCGTDGSCSGSGTCRFWSASTMCASASCTGATFSSADFCSGGGSCVDSGTTSCAPYACSGSACGTTCTSDTDCASGDLCEASTCRVPSSQVLSVSGTDSGVLLPTNPSFGDVGSSFTIELWFRPTTANVDAQGMLFDRRATGGDYPITYSVGDDGFVRWAPCLDDSSGCVSLVSTTQPSIGEWHHIAGVVAGLSVRLYLDGVLEDSATAPSSITWLASDTRATEFPEYAVFIGYDRSPGDGGATTATRFIGDVDDVRVSNVARYSGATISVPFTMASDASTVGLWTFQEASGTTALDTSPSGTLDGTIQGTARTASAR